MAEADFQGTILDSTGYADFGAPGLAPAARVNGHEMLQRYTGKDYDPVTELYYFNARWQNPELGRFITEDPIRDGVNWYVYCSNSPMVFTDPTGLETRLLTDTSVIAKQGHSAVLVDVYDEEGSVIGYNLFEVGPADSRRIKPKELSSSSVFGIQASVTEEFIPADSDVLSKRLERYDMQTIFNTSREQDEVVRQAARDEGRDFGQYNLFTNNCAHYTARSLESIGINREVSFEFSPYVIHMEINRQNADLLKEVIMN